MKRTTLLSSQGLQLSLGATTSTLSLAQGLVSRVGVGDRIQLKLVVTNNDAKGSLECLVPCQDVVNGKKTTTKCPVPDPDNPLNTTSTEASILIDPENTGSPTSIIDPGNIGSPTSMIDQENTGSPTSMINLENTGSPTSMIDPENTKSQTSKFSPENTGSPTSMIDPENNKSQTSMMDWEDSGSPTPTSMIAPENDDSQTSKLEWEDGSTTRTQWPILLVLVLFLCIFLKFISDNSNRHIDVQENMYPVDLHLLYEC